jgi:hypothetical protein
MLRCAPQKLVLIENICFSSRHWPTGHFVLSMTCVVFTLNWYHTRASGYPAFRLPVNSREPAQACPRAAPAYAGGGAGMTNTQLHNCQST